MRLKKITAAVLSLMCGILPLNNAAVNASVVYAEVSAVAAGPQEDGSFVMPDGTVYTAEQIASAETKPTISATQAVYTMEEIDAMGGIIPVTISVTGADMKWCLSNMHLYYDAALTPVTNVLGYPESTWGEAATYLSCVNSVEEGSIFTATAANENYGFDGDIVTYNFRLPEDYAPGDVYSLDLRYVSGDIFTNNIKDEAGMLMQAYAFSNLIDGYIEITENETDYTKMETGTIYDGFISDGSEDWYQFTSTTSGSYIFESTGSLNTIGYLYKSYSTTTSSSYIVCDDDSGEGNNFLIDYYMDAEETVFLNVKSYSSNESGSYWVSVNPKEEDPYSGTCGDNLTWTLKDGILTISGKGDMTDYSYSNSPWYIYKDSITNVVIEDGVTSIGERAFYGCYYITTVTISDSVTSIGDIAFAYCNALSSVTLPHSVLLIGDSAFFDCSMLTSITIENQDCEIFDSEYTVVNGFDDYNNSVYDGIIYGYTNSTAQAYAEKYGRRFIALDTTVTTTTTTTTTTDEITTEPITTTTEAPVTTTTTTTTITTTTLVTVKPEVPTEPAMILGDTDGDGVINSSDASNVLTAYALIATGGESTLTEEQMKAADVNKDGAVDSSDASSILAYYAFTATGGTKTLEEFLA